MANYKNNNQFSFEIVKKIPGKLGRAGIIHTPHGDIKTPAFMVVGTIGKVFFVSMEDLYRIQAQAMLSNGYHLRNTSYEIDQKGGLSTWSEWDGPTLTDSGGFQVMSLGSGSGKVVSMEKEKNVQNAKEEDRLAHVTEDGVYFHDPYLNQDDFIGPEESMQIQCRIGADIHMAFDHLAKSENHSDMEEAMHRTHRWLERCVAEHGKLYSEATKNKQNEQYLYAVVQGGTFLDLRAESAKFAANQPVDGFGIGGVFTAKGMAEMLKVVNNILPENKPRHLLGMGQEPIDLFDGAENGCDTFDCVGPTRMARNGSLYTLDGRINIKNAKYKTDFTPIDAECGCVCCQKYTRAYLHHLFRTDEITAKVLASIHNEHFVVSTVDKIRQSLLDGNFAEYKKEFLDRYYSK